MNAARAVVSVLLAVGTTLATGPVAAVDCLRPVGELPEGPSLAVDMEGSLAAFGRGRVLVLADLTDPSHPVELGSVVLPGVVEAVELTATHAWVAAGPAGLISVEVTDPSQPAVVSHLPAGLAGEDATAIDLALAGELAFVTETFEGQNRNPHARLRIVDVAAPASPTDVGAWDSQEYGHAGSITVAGGLAAMIESDLASGSGRMSVIDVSEPIRPTRVGGTDLGTRWMIDLALSGATVFVVGDDRLVVYDLSDPAQPTPAARRSTGRVDSTVVVDGELLVVGGRYRYHSGDPRGVSIYDISPPWLPTELGFVETPDPVAGVAARGGIVLAAAGRAGVRVIDASIPSEPQQVAALGAGGSSDWVVAGGGLALIGNRFRMTLVDLSDPAHPLERGDLPLAFQAASRAPALEGSFAFVGSANPHGIAVFDVSDPAMPEQITFLHLSDNPRALDSAGSRLYAITENALLAIDISDPWSPAVLGETFAGDGGYANLVAANDDLVAVANRACPWSSDWCFASLELFDAASASDPQLLDMMYLHADALAPRDDLVFVAGSSQTVDRGMVVIDVSDPTSPCEVAGLELASHAISMALGDGIAYVATWPPVGHRAVQVVSLRDPLHPWLIGEHPVYGEVTGVALSGNLLLVAEGYGGLLLLDATECAFPAPRHPEGQLLPGGP